MEQSEEIPVSENDEKSHISSENNTNAESMSLFEKLLQKQLGEDNSQTNEGCIEKEEQPETIPLLNRIKSSKWELRLHGFTEIKNSLQTCENLTDELLLLEDLLPNWIADRNVNAQKEALDVISLYFEKCDRNKAETIWNSIFPVTFEKCLNQSRLLSNCVNCFASVFSIIETEKFLVPIYEMFDKWIDKKGNAAVRGPAAKQMAGLLSTIEKIMKIFGATKLDVTSLVQKVAKYTAASDNTVKQNAYAVLQEVYMWTRNTELVVMFVPERQKAELERRCLDAPNEIPVPTRKFLNENKIQDMSVNPDKDTTSAPQPHQCDVDIFSLLPEIDILKDIPPEKWEKQLSAATKWKEKQEVFDHVTQACEKAQKVKSGDFSIFVSVSLRFIQTEGNLVVVISALKVCAVLAKTLRKSFANYAKSVAAIGISKLRDRSKPIICAVLQLLDNLLYCTSFENYLEDVLRAITDKSPNCRQHGLEWCIKSITHPGQIDFIGKCLNKFVTFALNSIDDSCVEVRNTAAILLGKLIENVKGDSVRRAISGLPPKKRQTATEVLARVQQQPLPTTELQSTLEKVETTDSISSVSKNIREKPTVCKRTISKSRERNGQTVSKPSTSQSTLIKQTSSKDDIVTECTLDINTVIEIVTDFFGSAEYETINNNINDKNWKNRVDAISTYGTLLQQKEVPTSTQIDALCVWIRLIGLKDFKEININVIKEVALLVTKFPNIWGLSFTKSCAAIFLNGLSEKISDAKLGAIVKDMIINFSEVLSPRFVIHTFLGALTKTTNPKTYSEACIVLEILIQSYGTQLCHLPRIIEFAKITLEKKQPIARSSAIKLLILLYRYLGPSLTRILGSDIKSSLLEEIIAGATLANTQGPPPAPTKKLHGIPSINAIEGTATMEEAELNPPKDFDTNIQLPRVVIKDFLTPVLLKGLSDAKWTIRKESAVKIQDIIIGEGKKNILPHGLSEVFSILRSRIQQEPNRPALRELLMSVSILGDSLGLIGIKQYIRGILPSVFNKFSDKTQLVREACIAASYSWLKSGAFSLWISALNASQILTQGGEEREGITAVLCKLDETFLTEIKTAPETRLAIEGLISCLFELVQDKNKVIRANTEEFLLRIAAFIPSPIFHKTHRSLRTPTQSAVRSIVTQCISISQQFSGETLKECNNALDMAAASKGTTPINFEVDGLSVTFSYSSSQLVINRLDGYRKSRWPTVLSQDEHELLFTVWRYYVNDALLSAMFDKSLTYSKGLEFWSMYIKDDKRFLSLCPKPGEDDWHVLDVLLKWLVLRITDSTTNLSVPGCDVLEEFLESYRRLLSDIPTASSAVSLILLSSALPQIMERVAGLPLQLKSLRDRHHDVIEGIMSMCEPQATTNVLLRSTTSSNKRLVIESLEHLSTFLSKKGFSLCNHVARDISKLGNIAAISNDIKIKNSVLSVLATLYCHLGHAVVDLCTPADLRQRFILYLKHNTHPIHAENEIRSETDYHGCVETDSVTTDIPDENIAADGEVHYEKNELGYVAQKGNEFPTIRTSAGHLHGGNSLVSNNNTDTEAPQLLSKRQFELYHKLGLKDFQTIFTNLLDTLEVDATLKLTQEQLHHYVNELEQREMHLFSQDLAEECRRLTEGKMHPNEIDMRYWNGKYRIEESSKGKGDSFKFLEEIRKVLRPDPLSIGEVLDNGCHRLSILLDATSLNVNEKTNDWLIILGSELINCVVFALNFCFDSNRLSRSEQDRDALCHAGQYVTLLITRIAKNKKVLHKISTLQLTELFKQLLKAMSSHGSWRGCDQETIMVKRLNSTVASHMMAVIGPRNAYNLVGMVINFLLDHRDQLDIALTLRVHRKLIKKLNSKKHPVGNLTQIETQYYLRLFDAAILCLKRLDSDTIFSNIISITDVSSELSLLDIEDHVVDLPKLKGQMEMLIKELIFIPIVILGSPIIGIYCRDMGFSSVPEHQQDKCTLSDGLMSNIKFGEKCISHQSRSGDSIKLQSRSERLNRIFGRRLESLMNTPYGDEFTQTICPSFLEASNFPLGNTVTYNTYHEWLSVQKADLQTPPLHYPIFSIQSFVEQAIPETKLTDLDPTLAAGWETRRETKAPTDVKHSNDLLQNWKKILSEIEEKVQWHCDTSIAAMNAKASMERGLVPNEVIGQYVRKCLSLSASPNSGGDITCL